MRYFFCLLYCSVFLAAFPFNAAHGQGGFVVIEEEFQNVPLAEVLNTLQEKYKLKIAFDQETIQNIYIDQSINKLSVAETFGRLFYDQQIDFQIIGENQVFIRQSLIGQSQYSTFTNCKGQILDALTGAPLAFATVVYAPGKGTSTNEMGAFSFQTEDTVSKIAVQYLGYESLNIPLSKPSTTNLTIRLTPKSTQIQSVTIVDREPLISKSNDFYGGIKLNARQLSTLPSFVGGKDVLRSLQFLPGVSAHDDLSAEIKVRGSNGEENMVVLDGIQLYNVSHFFGIFSIMNPSIVDEAKLYKNVFPIEFGGRTASVVDISTLPLENAKLKGSAEINLLTSSAYLELPLGPKMGLMLGGRITNKNVANTGVFAPLDQNTRSPRGEEENQNSLLFALNPDFNFYDVNAKWNWQASKNTRLTWSAFSGKDKFGYDFTRQFSNGFQTREDGIFSEKANWRNQGSSIQLEQQWGEHLSSQVVLSGSSYTNESQTTSFVKRFISVQEGMERVEITNNAQNEILGWDLLAKNIWSPNDRESFTFGAQVNSSLTNSLIQVDDSVILETDKLANQFSLFAEYHTQINQKLNLTLGLRPTYYEGTEKIYFSPRIYLTYPTTKLSYFKASWSQYNQFLRQSVYENRLGRTFDFWVIADDKRFPVSNSQQFMFGWNMTKNGFELDVELYHKKIKGILEYALVFSGVEEIGGMLSPNFEYRLFEGDGRSYGIDILLKKEIGNYSGWLAYTLSETLQSFPQIANGIYYPSSEDRRHQLKWINQYKFKRWDFSLAYVFTSGAPFTDISRLANNQSDRRQIDPNDRISYLENYHRVDLGVTYRFPVFGTKGTFGFSVFNLFDQKNVKYRQYNYAPNTQTNSNINLIGTEVQMLGITPNLSFKINFGQ